MGLLKTLFGGSKNAETIITKGAELLDNAFYTKQEKAENKKSLWGLWIEYQKATSGQNLARRVIALMVVGVYLFLILFAVAVLPFIPKWSEMIFVILRETLMKPFLLVIGFYFATHLLRAYKK